jgi:hypothetical protein
MLLVLDKGPSSETNQRIYCFELVLSEDEIIAYNISSLEALRSPASRTCFVGYRQLHIVYLI